MTTAADAAAPSYAPGKRAARTAEFTIQFDFVSPRADGAVQHRLMVIRASSAEAAENIAWMRRGTAWGAFGTDNALDCRAIERVA